MVNPKLHEGGACRHQGRSNAGSACGAVRRPPQSDYIAESAAGGRGCRCFRSLWRQRSGAACHRREVAACQDRRADAGERFFGRSARQSRFAERKAMIDCEHDLAITKQAEALNISRGSVYYLPRSVPEADLAIMRRLDRLHLELPFAGSRMLRGLLAAEGCKIGRRHVKTLMRRMGIEALYRRPRTTKPEPGHKIYPYLLRGMAITRPNQVWAMDITYIPMARGFVYLAVVLDWFSRRVLSWRLSITMEAAFCVETLEDALARHGKALRIERVVRQEIEPLALHLAATAASHPPDLNLQEDARVAARQIANPPYTPVVPTQMNPPAAPVGRFFARRASVMRRAFGSPKIPRTVGWGRKPGNVYVSHRRRRRFDELAIATSCPIQSPYETQKTQYPWGFKPHFPLVSSTRFPDEPISIF